MVGSIESCQEVKQGKNLRDFIEYREKLFMNNLLVRPILVVKPDYRELRSEDQKQQGKRLGIQKRFC